MKYLIVLLLLSGCTHAVYRGETSPEFEDRVEQVVRHECGTDCTLKYCWLEERDLPFCQIDFSFMSTRDQARVIAHVEQSLHERVGFCGADSAATTASEVLFVGAVNSLIVFDQPASSMSLPEDTVSRACSSDPAL